MLLLTINHQSLIATKTARIVHAAKGRTVMEFGSRRAQGYDAANFGASPHILLVRLVVRILIQIDYLIFQHRNDGSFLCSIV